MTGSTPRSCNMEQAWLSHIAQLTYSTAVLNLLHILRHISLVQGNAASQAQYLQNFLARPSRPKDAGLAPLLVVQRLAARLELQPRPAAPNVFCRLAAVRVGQRL